VRSQRPVTVGEPPSRYTLPVVLSMVAVLPQPPLLVPQLAIGVDAETAALRTACAAAAARLARAAGTWIAVGADPGGRRTVEPPAPGSFVGFGVDLAVTLDTSCGAGPPPDPRLPLPLLVAGWVAAGTGAALRVRGELIAPDESSAACAALGAELAAGCAATADAVGLLVVGDGAATHGGEGPRHVDERATPFDAAVAAALAAADPAALAALDPALAAELHAVGRAPWQVLAGAAAARRWRGELLHSDAPFGVAYHVAVWTPRS
jgi:hypothetical protein